MMTTATGEAGRVITMMAMATAAVGKGARRAVTMAAGGKGVRKAVTSRNAVTTAADGTRLLATSRVLSHSRSPNRSKTGHRTNGTTGATPWAITLN